MSTNTPETDKLDPERHDMIEHARRLERERDALRAQLEAERRACSGAQTETLHLRAEVERLRYIIERDTPYAPKEDKP